MTSAIGLERDGSVDSDSPQSSADTGGASRGEEGDGVDPRWNAVMQRDARWDGAFVFAVTSTRIYCRPSCPARRPRADRVRYYATATEAKHAGFRACKRCLPDAEVVVSERRLLVSRAVEAMERREDATLDELAQAVAVSRAHLQRTFVDVIGVSPLEYVTARKAERMRIALAAGAQVSAAAYDAGFESLPRAYAAASRHMGMPPGAFRRGGDGVDVRYHVAQCALGAALIALTERGICRVILGNDGDSLVRELRDEYPKASLGETDEAMSRAIDAVVEAASGKAQSVEVPIDLQGTAFQQRVWRMLTRIPPGETVSYTALARAVESPNAVRAVGSACGANPVALLIPCHRVVRHDGGLGGYRWGLARKERILDAERLAAAERK